MSRVLAIDYGRRRVGIAISDETKKIAMPLETLLVRSDDELIEKLKEIVVERDVDDIVIGNPVRTDTGEASEISRDVFVLRDKIKKALGYEVHLIAEWFSSAEAERILKSHSERHLKRRGLVDKLSAALILQTYLDSLWQE